MLTNKWLFRIVIWCFFEFAQDIDEFARNYFEFVLDFSNKLKKFVLLASRNWKFIAIGD